MASLHRWPGGPCFCGLQPVPFAPDCPWRSYWQYPIEARLQCRTTRWVIAAPFIFLILLCCMDLGYGKTLVSSKTSSYGLTRYFFTACGVVHALLFHHPVRLSQQSPVGMGCASTMKSWPSRWLKKLWPVFLVSACIATGFLAYEDNQNAASSTSYERQCLNSCQPLSSRLKRTYSKPVPGKSIDLDNPKKVECFCGKDVVGTRFR